MSQRRDQLNTQCDALAAEVESKRRFFLSDLEYEEHSKRDAAKRCVTRCDETSRDLQLLLHSTREVLRETDHCTFLQVTFTQNLGFAFCSLIIVIIAFILLIKVLVNKLNTFSYVVFLQLAKSLCDRCVHYYK